MSFAASAASAASGRLWGQGQDMVGGSEAGFNSPSASRRRALARSAAAAISRCRSSGGKAEEEDATAQLLFWALGCPAGRVRRVGEVRGGVAGQAGNWS